MSRITSSRSAGSDTGSRGTSDSPRIMNDGTPTRQTFPRRFRRRLMISFVAVASLSAGALAVGAYAMTSSYRWQAFERRSQERAATVTALASPELRPLEIASVVSVFSAVQRAEIVAVAPGEHFSSNASLTPESVPGVLRRAGVEDGSTASTTVDGREYLVVAGTPGADGPRLYFFFDKLPLQDSLADLAVTLGIGWGVVTSLAALAGNLIARRTLRPVGEAAGAAHAVAEGLLDTRIAVSGSDEFSVWAAAFNKMAAALQEQLQQVSDAHQRERRFTGNVAHELLTPIGALVTEASLLEQHAPALPPDAKRVVELVAADSRRLARLVEELLDLARLDAARATSKRSGVDLREVVGTVVSNTSIDVREILPSEPVRTLTDPACVERILDNLVRNAVVHGATPIEVEVHSADSVARISVRDHGPGIDESHLPRLFDRFYKGDSARSGGGAGLGLAIAMEAARVVDGTIHAANAPDGGVVFTLELPLVAPPPSELSDETVTARR